MLVRLDVNLSLGDATINSAEQNPEGVAATGTLRKWECTPKGIGYLIKNAKIGLIVLLCFAFVQTTISASKNEPNLFAVYLTWQNDPAFYALFPFPGKQGYNILHFGSYMSIALLDSGHTNFIGGEQAHWLYHALEKRAAIPHKFAIYHVPAFPSVRKSTGIINTLIRQNWVPIFDFYLQVPRRT